MLPIYFYRDYLIMRNNDIEKKCKWVTYENGDIRGNTLDEIKNNIDKHVGGHPTRVIPTN